MAAVLKWAALGSFHAQIPLLGPPVYGLLYGTGTGPTALPASQRTCLANDPRTLPAPQSHLASRRTSPSTRPAQPVVSQPPAATPGATPADALDVLRRRCPLDDVLGALGADSTDFEDWTRQGCAWPLYRHPAGGILTDPAAVLDSMVTECAA
jgi:hypothetical protein